MSYTSSVDKRTVASAGSNPFAITQILSGPSVGLTEFHNHPVREINLSSSYRDYYINHSIDETKTGPQCTIIEIPLTNIIITNSDANVKNKSKKSKFFLFDSNQLKSSNSMSLSSINKISSKERLLALSDERSLISALVSYIQSGQINDSINKSPTDIREQMIVKIKNAVTMIITNESSVLKSCHSHFRKHSIFGAPINGGFDVETFFLRLFSYFISNIKIKSQRICKLPSTFIIRLVWSKYISDGKKIDARSSLLCSELENNFDLFVEVIRTCLESQLVLDYLSFSEGHLDR